MRSRTTRRLAAVGALAAVIGALVLLAVALLSEPARLVVAVPVAAIAVASAWTALTTRGLVRVLATVLAALALAAVVVLCVNAGAVAPLVAALVLAMASGALADVALPDLPAPEGARAPPPRRAVFFMNPKSGGGKVGRFDLIDRARAAGAEVVLIERGLDLAAAADAAARGGADLLGVAGGDGSQALVAGVAARHDVPFLVVPAGTRNHFALDLGLDRGDPSKALDALEDGVEQRIDLGLVGDRIFVNNVSFGAYAEIVSQDEYRDAKLATALRRLPELVGAGAPVSGLSYSVPGQPAVTDAQVVLVSNNIYGFHTHSSGTRERLDEGVLGIVSVRMGTGRDAARLVLRGPGGLPGWNEAAATEVEVAGQGETVAAGVDGESLSLPSPVRLRVMPGALRVRLPRTGIRRVHRMRRAGLSAIPRLLAVAAGRHDPALPGAQAAA